MNALAACLLVVLVPQDEPKLKEAWPQLAEAWKAMDEYKPSAEAGALDDEFLRVAAKLHGAFEAAGLFAAEGEYLPQAAKAFFKVKARGLLPSSYTSSNQMFARRIRIMVAPGGGEALTFGETNPLGALMASLKKLQTLAREGLDDEDNVQDELATARKALKSLGLTADDTPPALRRRALHLVKAIALGEAYPEPVVAGPEQAAQIRGWIGDLGNEMIETREAATKELLRAGEAALPFLRTAAKSADAEVVARARRLLGVGHAPWTRVQPQEDGNAVRLEFPGVIPAPPPAPAPPPKEEKPK